MAPRLNDLLLAGELDIGPIAVVEYLRHADVLVLPPGLAVRPEFAAV